MARHDDQAKQLRSFIKRAQEELEGLQDRGHDVLEDARDKRESFEDFVKENPFLSMGIALAGGYFLGRLFKKRRRR